MNTAITLDQMKTIPGMEHANSVPVRQAMPEDEKGLELNGPGNTKRLKLIFGLQTEQADVFELFGWQGLPDGLKELIRADLNAYRDELLGLYSTCEPGVLNRRKRVSYWIRAYREGLCSEETAVESLSCSLA
ncbi:hypothetical protein QA596_03555 [Balneolales bacterium ANBcel1]|nr:hypothetical protein [Balneolales bacterium ANBcel1]